jgi:putative flippase GtrA
MRDRTLTLRFVRDSHLRFRELIQEVAKFGIIGLLAVGIAVGGADALRSGAHLGDLISVTISTIAATIFAFVGSKYWTFRLRKGSHLRRESLLFFVFNGVGLLIQLAFVWAARHGLGLTDRVSYNVANITGVVVATVFRLYCYRRWVFLAVLTPSAGRLAPEPPRT